MTEPYIPFEAVRAPQQQDTARLILLILGSLLGVFFLYQVGGGALTLLVIGDLSVTKENVSMFRTVTLVSQMMFILAPSFIIARFSGISWASVFPFRMPSVMEIALSFFGLLSLQRVLETLLYLQSLIPIPEIISTFLGPIKEMVKSMMMTLVGSDTPLEFMAVLLVVAIVPAVVEEVFFRGLVQSLLSAVSKPIWGVFGSGIIFGLFHLNPFDAIGLVGLGIFLAYTRYRSASMVIPILLHFVNNALAVIAVTAGMANEELLIESVVQEPSIGMVLAQGALFTGLFVVIIRLYQRMTDKLHQPETPHAL